MSGDRQKTAGEAAVEKIVRRENGDDGATEKAAEAARRAASGNADDGRGTPGEYANRSPQEREKGLTPGAVQPSGLKPTPADTDRSAEQLRDDVAAAREDLAGTVEELSRRLDPRPKVEEAKRSAESKLRLYGPPAAAAVAVVAIGIVIYRRRR